MDAPPAAVACLVQRAERGDAAAHGELFAALYAELHRLARREAARYGPNGRLGTTTLLQRPTWTSRSARA